MQDYRVDTINDDGKIVDSTLFTGDNAYENAHEFIMRDGKEKLHEYRYLLFCGTEETEINYGLVYEYSIKMRKVLA